MVKTYSPPEHAETQCPVCGGAIKAPPSPRNRRVQCPKCREVVVIESRAGKAVAALEAQSSVKMHSGEERSRVAGLEERVAALEAALVRMVAGSITGGGSAGERKLLWVGHEPGGVQEFSAAQGEALVHNLGTVAPQEITIRIAAGDALAGERALWFQAIFLRAGWKVRGPEQIAPENVGRVLSLAVPELPVAEEVAKTYLALRASGFEPVPVLDSAPVGSSGACALSLTIPSVRAAPPPPPRAEN